MTHLCWRCLFVCLLVLPLGGIAEAHMTSMGQFLVEISPKERTIKLTLSISRKDVGTFLKYDKNKNGRMEEDELKALRGPAASYFAERLLVSNNSQICPVAKQRYLFAREKKMESSKRLMFFQEVKCPKALQSVMIQNTVMFDDVGGYRHVSSIRVGKKAYPHYFARFSARYVVEIKTQPAPQTRKPTAGSRVAAASSVSVKGEGGLMTLWRFARKGGYHILFGLDHLLFLFCLLLVSNRIADLLWVVTAFTVGHSITLVLCVMDIVFLPVKPTEAMIALTIAYVGVENIIQYRREKPPRYRFVVAALFGMIHGFGFSYMLRELNLPKDSILLPLIGFNVGIELCQFLIVLVVYPFLYRAMKSERYGTFLVAANGLVVALALYWFVERAFG